MLGYFDQPKKRVILEISTSELELLKDAISKQVKYYNSRSVNESDTFISNCAKSRKSSFEDVLHKIKELKEKTNGSK